MTPCLGVPLKTAMRRTAILQTWHLPDPCMTTPVYVVLGAGPGLGLSAARRFARGGYAVTLVGESVEQMEPLAQALRDEGFDAEPDGVELTDDDDVTRVLTGVGKQRGRIDVLHFNPSAFRQVDALHLTTAELFEDLAVGVAPVLPAVQAAKPFVRPAPGCWSPGARQPTRRGTRRRRWACRRPRCAIW